MTTPAPLAVALREVGHADAGRVGRKAANLGELIRAGFPVPDGFVLSAEALHLALSAAGTATVATVEQVRSLPLPAEVARALADGFATVGGESVALAVRSSGIAEDLADRSYAGQYESVLNVVGAQALADAVRACWASAYADRVGRYASVADQSGRMAVLIQPMVDADAAGIAFTANPVTGDLDETVINAVRGLGDRLAAGEVTPDEWSVRDGAVQRHSGTQDALTAEAAAEIAAVARRAAATLGGPQDIEWVLAAGRVHVVQARPITALPVPPPAQPDAPEGFWLRGSYSLQPLSPMNVPTILHAVNQASHELFRYALGSRIEVRSIGGWSYVRFVPPQDPAAMRAKLTGVAAALADGEPYRMVSQWRSRWEPAAAFRVARMQATELSELRDRALQSELTRRQAFAERMQRLHFLVGGAATIQWGELGLWCQETLGWDISQVLDLLVGLPGKTTEPSVALAALVASARRDAALQALLTAPVPESLAGLPRDYAAQISDYLDRYGQRCLGADIAEPTMAERPVVVLRLIADQLATGRDGGHDAEAAGAVRADAVQAARSAVPSSAELAEFERLLTRGQDAYPLRDDTAFYGHVAWGHLRYAILELAARLVRRGQLDTDSDVFLLTLDEARAALSSGTGQQELVKQRAEEVAYAAAHRGPLTIGTPTGPPPRLDEALAGLPDGDRARLAVLRWVDAAYSIGMERVEQDGTLLRGVAASAGSYTGPARVLISEADFGKLCPGDVLVCPETTPQWSVLFGSVGALVTDTGGMLSHPAIIAREYRVPAVVATGNATKLLTDGQLVRVDGTTGHVEILAGEGEKSGGSNPAHPGV